MARLSTQQIAAGLRQAGFAEDMIPTMTAVTMAESGGNPRAHNPNRNTGDNSYGLLQINMIDGMGPERRRQFGIDSDDQLFDPITNFRAAKQIYDSQGINAWGAYTNGSYKKYLGSDTSAGAELPTGGTLPAPASDTTRATAKPSGGLTDGMQDELPVGEEYYQYNPVLSQEQNVALGGLSVDMSKLGTNRMAGSALGGGVFDLASKNPVEFDRMAGDPNARDAISGKRAPQGGNGQTPVAGSNTFVTGNTGASTGPHLDFRVYSKSRGGYVDNPGDYTHLVTTSDGRSVADAFQMTSPYGMRTHPTKGGQRLHQGIDYATPSGTKLSVAGNFVERKSEPGGGGNYSIYQHPDNPDLELVLMHGS